MRIVLDIHGKDAGTGGGGVGVVSAIRVNFCSMDCYKNACNLDCNWAEISETILLFLVILDHISPWGLREIKVLCC